MLRFGVDVGGTNTDVVLLKGSRVVGHAKTTTTPDLLQGVHLGLSRVLHETGYAAHEVEAIMLGTTHFVNALIQRKGLSKVYVIRLCGPSTSSIPPFADMPKSYQVALCAGYALCAGGKEYNGKEDISKLSNMDMDAAAQVIAASKIASAVICGVFSPVDSSQEETAAALLRQSLQRCGSPHINITLSHQVGQLGLLERENASILNAALQPLAARLVPAIRGALLGLGLRAPLFITANDGTLLPAHVAEQLPIATLQSGPVNSVRGAVFLSGQQDALVVDIGGTTTDVGAAVNGLPRPAGKSVSVCGIPINFSMPDVFSIGLGGGSHVRWGEGAEQAHAPQAGADQAQRCSVGPLSVGHELGTRALVSGGDVCTATDVAVALNRMKFGSRPPDALGLTQEQLNCAWKEMQGMIAGAVERMKVSRAPVPVVVVGGGAALCGDEISGASQVIRPQYGEVANAVGAAVPQVSGLVEGVYELGPRGEHRDEVLQQLVARAVARAVESGAVEEGCKVVEREEVPLAYMTGGAARLRVRVVGDLALGASQLPEVKTPGQGSDVGPIGVIQAATAAGAAGAAAAAAGFGEPTATAAPVLVQGMDEGAAVVAPTQAISTEVPAVANSAVLSDLSIESRKVNDAGEWELSVGDVEAVAVGAQILGTGGGGSAQHGKLIVLGHMERGKKVRVVAVEHLPEDALVVDCGGMGAPTVSQEKLSSGQEEAAVRALARSLGRQPTALLCAEVGGGSCMAPMEVGAAMGLPVVDADLMGRAFPELQMMTSCIYGVPITPAAIVDEKGNELVMAAAASMHWVERVLRAACETMGASVGLATSAMSKATLDRVAIKGSISLAWRLGTAVLKAQQRKEDPVQAVLRAYGGEGVRLIFVGKVVDVGRTTSEGFVRGRLCIDGVGSYLDQRLTIEFQNENLVATSAGSRLATVPDLICCLDTSSGQAIATEELRYGLRMSVVVLPASPLMCTPEALRVVGPAAFGYDI